MNASCHLSSGNRRWHFLLIAAGLVLLGGCGRHDTAPVPAPRAAAPSAATNSSTNELTDLVFFYEPPHRSQKKMEILANIPPAPPSGASLPVTDFKLITYSNTGGIEITLTAPSCDLIYSPTSADASSAGPIHAETGDGRFVIDGTGFLWRQEGTNATLIISNHVTTTVQKELLAAGGAPTNARAASGTNQFVKISSDQFTYDRVAGLVTYSGHVGAEDDQLQLSSGVITLQRAADGPIRGLVADTNVVIISKSSSDRFTGNHAVYVGGTNGAQFVTLTGDPRWQGADGQGTAGEFVFDHANHTFQARDNARFQLLLSGTNNPGGFLLAPGPVEPRSTNGPPQFADVSADNLTMQLPVSNGPPQSVIADGHVVIVDEAGGGRAQASRAISSPAENLLELLGQAQYQSGDLFTSAEQLTLNKTTRAISARTNALLRFPPSALGKSAAFGKFLSANSTRTTNGLIEVTSGDYDYQNNELAFHDHVKAGYSAAGVNLGTLDCGALAVDFHSNGVDRIVAEQNVHLRQPPSVDARGRTTEGTFDTQRVEIQMRTNGFIDTVHATGGVTASQTQTAAGVSPVHLTLAADTLTAPFLPNTNQVESVTADGNVRLARDEVSARGAKVVYTSTNQTAVLTGNPLLVLPHVQITATDAVVYDRVLNIFQVIGNPQTLANGLATGSNALVPPAARKKKTP